MTVLELTAVAVILTLEGQLLLVLRALLQQRRRARVRSQVKELGVQVHQLELDVEELIALLREVQVIRGARDELDALPESPDPLG